jgi:hypothetical protein
MDELKASTQNPNFLPTLAKKDALAMSWSEFLKT